MTFKRVSDKNPEYKPVVLIKPLHLTLKKKWFDLIASGEFCNLTW